MNARRKPGLVAAMHASRQAKCQVEPRGCADADQVLDKKPAVTRIMSRQIDIAMLTLKKPTRGFPSG